MQRYARVTDGIVTNVCVGSNLPAPFIHCPDVVSVGWSYRDSDGAFLPPVQTRRWTAFEFLNRFTPVERAAIRTGSMSDPALADFLMMSQAAQEIVSDDPMTVAGMDYLVSLGILTPARRAEILS